MRTVFSLFYFDDLHHVGAAFTRWVTGGHDKQLAWLQAVALGDGARQFVIVGQLILDIREDRRYAPVGFQLALRALGERDGQNWNTRSELGDSLRCGAALREDDNRTDVLQRQCRSETAMPIAS